MGMANLEFKTPSELLDDIVRLRKALERIRDFPYVGEKAAQQMALIAGEALTMRQGK